MKGGNWRMEWLDSTLHTTSEHPITAKIFVHLGVAHREGLTLVQVLNSDSVFIC